MTSNKATQWDFGRFIKTLSYFGEVPFLSQFDWFQQWFGSRSNPKVDSSTIVHPQSTSAQAATPTEAVDAGADPSRTGVFVVGASGKLGQAVVQQLLQQGYPVWIDPGYEQFSPEQLAQFDQIPTVKRLKAADLANSASASTDLDRIAAVIYCAGALQFDSSMADLIQQLSEQATLKRPVFDFAHPSPNLKEIWGALDDVVMGGVSQSSIQIGQEAANFSGVVSTANSGGFASIRTRNLEPPLNLADYDGVELQVKGDGNRYKFMLRTDNRWDGIAHCYSFDTVADQWISIRIPFQELVPVFRARTVPDSSLNLNQVYAWQLMLSKFEYDGALNPRFEPGPFQLQIRSIQVYRQTWQPQWIGVNPSESDSAELKTRDIPYVAIYPSTIVESSIGHLQLSRHSLSGQVSATAVAMVCAAALAQPKAQTSVFVTESMTPTADTCALGDWECLQQTLANLSDRF